MPIYSQPVRNCGLSSATRRGRRCIAFGEPGLGLGRARARVEERVKEKVTPTRKGKGTLRMRNRRRANHSGLCVLFVPFGELKLKTRWTKMTTTDGTRMEKQDAKKMGMEKRRRRRRKKRRTKR